MDCCIRVTETTFVLIILFESLYNLASKSGVKIYHYRTVLFRLQWSRFFRMYPNDTSSGALMMGYIRIQQKQQEELYCGGLLAPDQILDDVSSLISDIDVTIKSDYQIIIRHKHVAIVVLGPQKSNNNRHLPSIVAGQFHHYSSYLIQQHGTKSCDTIVPVPTLRSGRVQVSASHECKNTCLYIQVKTR